MRERIRTLFGHISHNRFAGNAGWMMAERLFQLLVSFTVGMMSARYLGPANYGIINYVAAFVAFGVPICGLGLEGVLVKAYVDDRKRAGEAVATAALFEFCVSLIVSAVIIVIVSVINVGDGVKMTVAVLESFQLVFKSAEPIEYWYNSQLRSKYTSIIKIAAYSVLAAYRLVLIVLGKSVVWFAFAMSIDFVVMGILFWGLYLKQDNPPLRIDLSLGRKLLGSSHHFIYSGLMAVAYSQMDKIMLEHMLSERDVGLYSAAYMICSAWFFIPVAIIASARPLIMEAKNHDEDLYINRLSRLYASIFWLSALVAAVVSIRPQIVIWVLYGSEYIEAANALRIGIWFGIFAQLGSARTVWLLSENRNRYEKYFLLWGVIINLVLNYVLIRPLGINGAALATLITQIFTCMIAPLMYKETRSHTGLLIDAILLKWRSYGKG